MQLQANWVDDLPELWWNEWQVTASFQFYPFPGEQSSMRPEYRGSVGSAGKMSGVIRLLNAPGRFIIGKLEDFFER